MSKTKVRNFFAKNTEIICSFEKSLYFCNDFKNVTSTKSQKGSYDCSKGILTELWH